MRRPKRSPFKILQSAIENRVSCDESKLSGTNSFRASVCVRDQRCRNSLLIRSASTQSSRKNIGELRGELPICVAQARVFAHLNDTNTRVVSQNRYQFTQLCEVQAI